MCRVPLNQATRKKQLLENIRRIFSELEQNNQIHTEYLQYTFNHHEEESDENASVIDNTDNTDNINNTDNIDNIFRINEQNIIAPNV